MEQQEIVLDSNFKDPKIKKRYEEGLKYQKKMGFTEKWPEYERFFAGDQWPAATEATKNLPRPVFNIIKYIQTHKKASVMNENIKMNFTSSEVGVEDLEVMQAVDGASKFTKFSEATWERIQQDELNSELIANASNCGTGILHYYWNNELSGGITTPYSGDFEGEIIDPSNIFFGNPQQNKVQKQPYIIITSREPLDVVKKIAENNGLPAHILELIKGDKDTSNEIYDTAKHELDDDKVTVITQYYKKGKEVFFKKCVNEICFVPETNTMLQLYPIALFTWTKRKKCIYGIGDTEGLIANQKAINFSLAMMLLSVQQAGWPKLITKPGALKQKVTNQPGEMLVDHYIGNGEGIKYLQGQAFNPGALTLTDKFIEITKNLAGANDAAVGEAPGADMAAQAIMLLQRSAGLPLEDIKKTFYRTMEDVGRIWEQFWKHSYNLERAIKVKNEVGEETMETMIGTDYQDYPMDLRIDIGPSSTYSEYMAQATLDKLYDKGAIDTVLYLKYSSPNNAPFKERLGKELEDRINNAIAEQGMMPGGEMPMDEMPREEIAPGDSTMNIPGVKEPNVGGINNGKM